MRRLNLIFGTLLTVLMTLEPAHAQLIDPGLDDPRDFQNMLNLLLFQLSVASNRVLESDALQYLHLLLFTVGALTSIIYLAYRYYTYRLPSTEFFSLSVKIMFLNVLNLNFNEIASVLFTTMIDFGNAVLAALFNLPDNLVNLNTPAVIFRKISTAFEFTIDTGFWDFVASFGAMIVHVIVILVMGFTLLMMTIQQMVISFSFVLLKLIGFILVALLYFPKTTRLLQSYGGLVYGTLLAWPLLYIAFGINIFIMISWFNVDIQTAVSPVPFQSIVVQYDGLVDAMPFLFIMTLMSANIILAVKMAKRLGASLVD